MSETQPFDQPMTKPVDTDASVMQDTNTTAENEQYERRFQGTRTLYGASTVDIFAAAHVYVIGIGGVGSWAAEALARTAVGTVTLIDLDVLVASSAKCRANTII